MFAIGACSASELLQTRRSHADDVRALSHLILARVSQWPLDDASVSVARTPSWGRQPTHGLAPHPAPTALGPAVYRVEPVATKTVTSLTERAAHRHQGPVILHVSPIFF